ncbi:hypothetical protein OFB84_31820, partial [Escherichia coli]|nr:hypothetical protein [Escherichia coli]
LPLGVNRFPSRPPFFPSVGRVPLGLRDRTDLKFSTPPAPALALIIGRKIWELGSGIEGKISTVPVKGRGTAVSMAGFATWDATWTT